MAKVYAQVMHGRNKNYQRRDNDGYDFDVPPRPKSQQSAGAYDAPPRPKAKPGAMPAERKQQIIDQNLQRQDEAFQKQQAGYAQSDRRMRAIKTAQLEASREVSREDDRKALLANNQSNETKARPAVPIVMPASTAAATQAGAVPPRLAQAMNNVGMTAEAHQQHSVPPRPIPLSAAGQTAQTIIDHEGGVQGGYNTLETARLAGSSNPMVSGQMQDAADMYGRMDSVDRVNTGQATALYPGRTSPGGIAGVQGGQMEIYNRTAPPPRPSAAPAPIVTSDQSRFGPTRPVIAGTGPLEDRLGDAAAKAEDRRRLVTLTTDELARPSRLQTQVDAVRAGQDAIDQGTSLEAQAVQRQEQDQRQHEVNVASASNPPRQTSTGTVSQPKPALPPEKAAKVSALVSELRKANLPEGRAEQIQKEIDDVLAGVPKRGMIDMLKDAWTGIRTGAAGQAEQPPAQTQPQTLRVGETVDVPNAPPGATAVSPDGKRFKVNGVWTQ